MKKITLWNTICLLIVATLVSGCYPMPQDDDYCLIPVTNNPDITGNKGSSLLPGVGY